MAEIIVFADSNFRGNSNSFTQDLANVGTFWNDKITSAKVISGTWQVFGDTNFTGSNVKLPPGEYPNLAISPGVINNDSISSLKIVG
ncbi:beta/gamma crystallin-related protein [Microcoleus sp. herbarium14]|uniref:beta/gamma crystallin-related protein n=1 Tax=Microcoleus sp. herbarium14 TaxID=3055439 RepID=UPI002FCEE7FE